MVMKVAFATGDLVSVNEHFRRASNLAVYEVGPTGHHRLAVSSFPRVRTIKTKERLEAIAGVSVVYGVAFLPSTVARLTERGIRAATAPPGTPIEEVLLELARRATE